jgi:hypothetical protein
MTTEREVGTPKIRPAPGPPTPEELERRRLLLEQTFKLRDAIGPVGLTTSELLAEPEEEVDD